MKSYILIIISLTSAVIISMAVGFNLFLIWNLLPVVAFYFITNQYFKSWNKLLILPKICLIFLGLFLIIFPTLVSIMWIFDIEGTSSSSSTSGLIFLFIPLWAFVFSLIPFIILNLLGNKI